ncbi:trichothecene 3-o-acetyltransferase protein [Diplodia corticola]|uniref:Trichothecene 3-o-acetyltransferase protein n=1 Tax=Diplodia corticola TaxID=236234 RepID=A0A1J9RM85_9PEZI|nr:trichothecene 3-o-acetyltransferase protein [Diplodia corticola]OJD29623.1 trichothecene 3-o-acetyltransferase protein [Diplodia corticola]
MGKETFCIRPLGHENGPETEVFQMSDFDYLAPPVYTMLSLCYKLDEQQSRDTIVQNLKESLQITVDQYRIVAARVQTEAGTGRLSAVRKRDGGVNFTINVMNEADDFLDFETLNQANFTSEKMDVNKLFPDEVSKRIASIFQDTSDPPAVVVQANFIRGGLILCVAAHHRISDGTGTNQFVNHWAANSHALSTKAALPAFDVSRLDRSPLCFRGPPPSEERMAELKQQIGFVHHAGEGDNPQPSTEPISLITLHFPKTKLASLKADASPTPQDAQGRRDSATSYSSDPEKSTSAEDAALGSSTTDTTAAAPVSWISTYDAIVATIWRAVTRARLPVFHSLPGGPPATSSQLHAVDLRSVAGVPATYYGNAMALPTQTLPLSTLTSLHPPASSSPSPSAHGHQPADPSLAAVATAIRAGITRCSTRATAAATAEWIAGTADKSRVTLPNLIGTGLYCTSWRSMSYYRTADFGFGLPNRVRRPPIVADGIAFVYPQRPEECGAAPDEGIDVVLGLAKGTAGRFLADEELLRYARVVEG